MRNETTPQPMTVDALFAKYEPNPSELLKSHDAYNERTGFNVSMPGLRTRSERERIYRDWERQDAKAEAR